MTPARLTIPRLRQLATELADRHTAAVQHLSRARVLTGAHLDRLLPRPDTATAPRTAQRARQRAMTHLCRLGLVAVLDRRIGGVRAGSAGHVHVLTPAGHKLAAILTGGQLPAGQVRRFRAPGPMAVAHALDIAEIYVQLVEASRGGGFDVAAFVTEPATWWREVGVSLRPDAYTVLAAPTHRDCWWLEIDRDTESVPRLREKLRDYLDHFTSGGLGPDGAAPRVLITVPESRRRGVIADVITGLPPPAAEVFWAVEHHDASRFLITAVHDIGETE